MPPPAKPGYVVEGVQEASSSSASSAPVEEVIPDFGTVLPAASVSAGQQVATRCQQCHNLDKGGPNNIGPNLWGIVGRARATHPGFDYSSAMMSSHEPWTYENLFRYLKSPASMVPGTKMSFRGPAQRNRPYQSSRLSAHAGRHARADSAAVARKGCGATDGECASTEHREVDGGPDARQRRGCADNGNEAHNRCTQYIDGWRDRQPSDAAAGEAALRPLAKDIESGERAAMTTHEHTLLLAVPQEYAGLWTVPLAKLAPDMKAPVHGRKHLCARRHRLCAQLPPRTGASEIAA